MGATLRAGAAETIITPPAGIDLTGYGYRPSAAVGKHDDLYAKALVLEADGRQIALVSIDILGFEIADADALRRRVEAETGIPADAVLLNCSHTHAGPATMTLRGLGERDATYDALLARWIVSTVSAAQAHAEPAILCWGESEARIGMNRRQRQPSGRMVIGENEAGDEPRVPALRLDREEGRPLAIWFSHATHPVTFGNQNVRFSADYCGAAGETLRRLAPGGGSEFVALFAQGCCGDINPRRRGEEPAVMQVSGRILGAAAAIAAEESTPIEATPLAAAFETLALPTLAPDVAKVHAFREEWSKRLEVKRSEGADAYQLRLPEALLGWADDALAAAGLPAEKRTLPFPVQALRLGPVAIVALAGEVFVQIGQEVARRSPFPHTVALGYSNGCLGYVPTADAYPLGGYEVDDAYRYFGTLMIAPESEAMIYACVDRLLGSLG